MNNNRIINFEQELKTYGDDITIEERHGAIIMRSEKTDLSKLEKDLLLTAAYYRMNIGLQSKNTYEFYKNNMTK